MRPGTVGQLGSSIKSFDQNRYTGRHIADALSICDEGYAFVPAACEQGAACRVHIALHGCKQDAGTIGRLFIEQTRYNAWADANGIIVLYPQGEPVSAFQSERLLGLVELHRSRRRLCHQGRAADRRDQEHA